MHVRHGEPRARGLHSSAMCNVEHDQSDPSHYEPISSNSEHPADAEDAARARAADTLLRSKEGLAGLTCDHRSKRRRKNNESQCLRDEQLHDFECLGAGSSREVGEQRQHNIMSHRNFGDETHTRIETGQHRVHDQGYRISENERHQMMWSRLFAVVPPEYHETVQWCKEYSNYLLTDRVKQAITISVQAKEIIGYAEMVKRYQATASAHDSKVAEMQARVEASEAKVAAAVSISEAKVAAAVNTSEAKVVAAEAMVRYLQAKVENAEKNASAAENRARALAGLYATGAPGEDTRVAAITADAVQHPSCPAPTEGTSDLGAQAIPRQETQVVSDNEAQVAKNVPFEMPRLTPPCMHCHKPHAASSGMFLLCGNEFCNKGTHMSCVGYREEPEYWYCCGECEVEDLKE